MLRVFRTKGGIRSLLLPAAILAPLLAGGGFLASWLESRRAPIGEPNDRGGLRYRAKDGNGVAALPAPLANVIRAFPEATLVEVSADTDETGLLYSATAVGETKDDLAKVAGFYAGPGRVPSQAGVSRRYNVAVVDLGPGSQGRRKFRVGISAL